jgi:hypothetical protein
MGTYKGIPGHVSKQHKGTVEEAHTRPETLHGFKTKPRESAVPEKKHAGESPSRTAPGGEN